MSDRPQYVVWGNENPDGPNYDPHPKECKCINCQLNQESEGDQNGK